MTTIKVEVTIDVTQSTQVDALNRLMCAIAGTKENQVPVEAPKSAQKPVKTKTEPKPADSEPEKTESVEEPKPEAKTSIKIEDVRALLAKKVDNNRPAIKQKLTDLGANNVTSLSPDKYEEFMDYLNSLQ